MTRRKFCLAGSLALFAAAAASCFLLACGEVHMSGGVSEETNTLAGSLSNSSGTALARSVVTAALVAEGDTATYVDTTDFNGYFSILVPSGVFAVSALSGSEMAYALVRLSGADGSVKLATDSLFDVSATILLSDSSAAEGAKVSLPGTDIYAVADASGKASLSIPQGNFALQVSSPNADFEDVYVAVVGSELYGPYPVSIAIDSVAGLEHLENSPAASLVWALPHWDSLGLVAEWTFDELAGTASPYVSEGEGGDLYVYGSGTLVAGLSGMALSLSGASDFAVWESDGGALENATAFSVEAWLSLEEPTDTAAYRRNIVGKVGFGGDTDSSVFTLALVNGVCDVTEPRIALFVADGSGMELSCENAVLDTSAPDFGTWTYYAAAFEEGVLKLFRDGFLVAEAETAVQTLGSSGEALYIGKEELALKIDALRLSLDALDEAEAFVRYYQQGGR